MTAGKDELQAHAMKQARSSCRCIRILLRAIETAWESLYGYCKKRRNSAKLYLYHSASACICFLSAGTAVAVHVVYANWITGHEADCGLEAPLLYDSDLRSETFRLKAAVGCIGEPAPPACDWFLKQMFVQLCAANAVFMGLQCACGSVLSMGFSMFTNLPQERLQFDKATRTAGLMGGICKVGPWAVRGLNLLVGLVLTVQWTLVIRQTCKGNLAETYACETFASDCAFNKLKNCKYWHSFCAGNKTQLTGCYTVLGRKEFSGRVDIRLVSEDECVRCQILKGDMEDSLDDEFWLLNASDRSDPSVWRCSASGTSCFDTLLWHNIACNCGDYRKKLNLADQAVSAWWAGLQAGCSDSSRILQEEEQDLGDSSNFNSTGSLPGELTPAPSPGSPASAAGGRACGFAPDDPAYFFSAERCETSSRSSFFTVAVTYMYFSGCSWMGLTVVGQAVRLLSKPEPWFYNPNAQKEGLFWKFVRFFGP